MSKQILMPELSPTMSTGMLSRWLVNIGDKIEVGDIIAEIETEKVTVEYEAKDSGYLESILVDASDQEINVGDTIALLSDAPVVENKIKSDAPLESSEIKSTKKTTSSQEPSKKKELAEIRNTKPSPSENLIENVISDIKVSPMVRRMAFEAGITINKIKGSGTGGRITKEDIRNAAGISSSKKQSTLSAQPVKSFEILKELLPEHEELPINNMRKTVADRLTQSSQLIPHFYMSVVCQMDELISLRQEINTKIVSSNDSNTQRPISINDFIIKAVAKSLGAVPEANVMWADNKLLAFKEADISIAVSLDGGLVTPVIKKCISQSLGEISLQASKQVEKAKTGKLLPQDFQGGNFTISNLGMFGIEQFNSIINPPQSGILSVGATESKPVVIEEEIVIRKVMTLTLAMDHRCVDGVTGAKLLKQIQKYIESPLEILI